MIDQNQKISFDPTSDDLGKDVDVWSDAIIASVIKNKLSSGKAKRQRLARDWFRSELFYNGVQWIKFDAQHKRWREVGFKRGTPTPVTNTYASYCDIFGSMLASIPIEPTFRPTNAASAINQTQMTTANDLSEAIKQAVKLQEKQRQAAPLITRHGGVYLIPRFVKGGNLQFDEPKNDPNSQPSESMQDVIAKAFNSANFGSDEAKEGESMPDSPLEEIGEPEAPALPEMPRLVVDVASEFECYIDENADTFEDSPHFARQKSYELSILKSMYPKFADRLKAQQKTAGNISQYYAGSLSRLTSGEFGGSGYFMASYQQDANRANLTEFWHDPCKNYPNGIYAIMINDDVIVEKGPLHYKDENGAFKNVIYIPAKRRTKNVHGRTPLDDAIPKQTQRNKLESFIELIIYRMAAPHWLLPKDSGIESISGEPGSSIAYNRTSASQNAVVRPEMVAGVPPHPVIMEWLRKIDEDTEYILGITKAFLGQMPPNTPAARALELLMQRSRERHGDIFWEWNAGFAKCMNMLLKIVKQVKPIDLFKSIEKNYGGFGIKQFTEEDFNIDLEIVPETEQPAPPRSTAGEIELISEFVTKGVFQMDPARQYQICNRYGLKFLVEDLASDKDYIARENYEFLYEGKVPIVQPFHNHALHFNDQRLFLQTEEFQQLQKQNPQLAQQYIEHVMAHQNTMMQLQAAQQPPPQQGVPGQAAPPPQGAAPMM